MHGRWKPPVALQVAMLFAWSLVPVLAEEPAVFPLTESSILDNLGDANADAQSQMFMYRVVENLGTTCTTTPTPDVTYPKLVSATPLYGRLPLANGSEDALDFVIDESQPVQEPAAKEEPSLLRQLGEAAHRIEGACDQNDQV